MVFKQCKIILAFLFWSINAQCQSQSESLSQAVNYFKLNNYTDAIDILEKTIPQIQSNDSIVYCDANNLLATCYIKTNKFDLAIESLKKTTKHCNQPNPLIKKNYTSALLNLAQLYIKVKNYSSAVLIWDEVLEVAKSNYGEKSQVFINLLNYYPTIYVGLKNYEKAEEKCFEIIDFKTQILGNKTPETILSKNYLGQIYLAQNRLNQAESIFSSVVSLKQDTSNRLYSQTYAISLMNLGKVYVKTRDYPKADSLLKITQIIFSNLSMNQLKNKDYLQFLEIQALVFNETERYFEAEKNYKILTSSLQSNTIEYLNAMSNLAADRKSVV